MSQNCIIQPLKPTSNPMKRILIVDDNADILELVEMILQRQGFDTVTSKSGEDALKNLQSYSPQLILLDVFLGSTNGVDICNQIKSDPQSSHISIIMFSAHTAQDIVFNKCTADDFIEKPFDVHHLLKKINFHIQSATETALVGRA